MHAVVDGDVAVVTADDGVENRQEDQQERRKNCYIRSYPVDELLVLLWWIALVLMKGQNLK
jgi:hypothetical protein